MRYMLSLLCLLIYTGALSQHISKEIYHIPAGFTGRISIIYDRPQASPLPQQEGARIYNIPNDGILVTSAKPLLNTTEHFYWYVDSIGNKTAIQIHDSSSQYVPTTKAVVFGIRKGLYPQPAGTISLHYVESIIVDEGSYDTVFHPKADILFRRRVLSKINRRL